MHTHVCVSKGKNFFFGNFAYVLNECYHNMGTQYQKITYLNVKKYLNIRKALIKYAIDAIDHSMHEGFSSIAYSVVHLINGMKSTRSIPNISNQLYTSLKYWLFSLKGKKRAFLYCC